MTEIASTFDPLWTAILDVGQDKDTRGYRRFAWSEPDLTLREWFRGCAEDRGMDVEEDRNGNLWAWWLPPGWTGEPTGAFVTGSHLDSVPDGGAFDGPLGVVSAFAAVDIVRERGVVPTIPVAIAAFSDEEGARFGVACVGSQLVTGALGADRARGLRDNDGVTLAEAMTRAGRKPEHLGVDEAMLNRIGVYVELHVEQGRALDLVDRPIAVASSIWPHGRWEFVFDGAANHAGTTRLADRRDPMLAFASSVHAARAVSLRPDDPAAVDLLGPLPGFQPGQKSSVAPNAPTGLIFSGDVRDAILPDDWNNLAPRVGIAWDVTGAGKLVVRSGYGVYFKVS